MVPLPRPFQLSRACIEEMGMQLISDADKILIKKHYTCISLPTSPVYLAVKKFEHQTDTTAVLTEDLGRI